MPYNFKADNFMAEHQRTCPACGKKFRSTADWKYVDGYGKNIKYYCRYTCWWKAIKEKEGIYGDIRRAIRDGLNDAEIKRVLGVTQRQIDNAVMGRRQHG